MGEKSGSASVVRGREGVLAVAYGCPPPDGSWRVVRRLCVFVVAEVVGALVGWEGCAALGAGGVVPERVAAACAPAGVDAAPGAAGRPASSSCHG